MKGTVLVPAILMFTAGAKAGELDLAGVVKGFEGRVGACVQSGTRMECVRGDEKFAMQSVMKLVVGVAALDSVDRRVRRLDDKVTIRREDLSLYVQPLAKLVGPSGYTTTVGDLVRRAIIDSDSAATDILIRQLGGPAAVQEVLKAKGIAGIRVDRNERDLQTEIVGLRWRPEYVDPAVLDRAIGAVPKAQREQAEAKYRVDIRDTATPKGMAGFLYRLAAGELLSASSTAFVLQAMKECATFPDRLKAGTAAGWSIAHKTGTSGTWDGFTVATNDVGVLTAPDGSRIAIAVFAADSRASAAERAAVIAKIAAATIATRFK